MGYLIEARSRMLVKALFLAGLVWAVYWNSLRNPFEFDDWHVISQNPAVRQPADVPSFFVDVSTFSILPGNRDYRPVFLTSMALCWWIGEGSTLPFHLVSVALHMANVLLLFFLFRRVSSTRSDPTGGLSPEDTEWAACLAAALFAVHPVAAESVNYISSQSILLADFFYLLGFYGFVSAYGLPDGLTRPSRWLRCLGSYFAYVLALLSKPIAVTLPVMLLLWELLLGRDRSPAAGEAVSLWSRWRHRLARHLPYFAITLGYLFLRKILLTSAAGSGIFFKQPLTAAILNFLTQTRAMVFYYLKLALFPTQLNIDLEFRRSTSILDWEAVFSLAIAGAIAWLLYRLFRARQRILVFWFLWFPTGLLITTYVMLMGQVVREARAYLSLIGLCAAAALLFLKLWRAFPVAVSDLSVGKRSGRFLASALIAVVLIFYGVKTRAQNRVWSSSLTLWQSAALNGGTWRAHMNYGLALEKTDRKDEALAELKKAVELGPYAYAHLNLGLAYVKRGSKELGLRHLRRAVELWPASPETHLYLAYGLEQNGRIEEAEMELREALRLRPDDLKGLRLIAEFYQRRGRTAEAIESYERLSEIDPGLTWAGERIRRLRQRPGESTPPDRATTLFRQAFDEQKQGERERAIELYEDLLALQPSHRQGTFNLAYEYLKGSSESDWLRSVALFEKVLEIDPDYTEALYRLASANWKLGNKTEAMKYDQLFIARPDAHRSLKQRSRERLAGEADG